MPPRSLRGYVQRSAAQSATTNRRNTANHNERARYGEPQHAIMLRGRPGEWPRCSQAHHDRARARHGRDTPGRQSPFCSAPLRKERQKRRKKSRYARATREIISRTARKHPPKQDPPPPPAPKLENTPKQREKTLTTERDAGTGFGAIAIFPYQHRSFSAPQNGCTHTHGFTFERAVSASSANVPSGPPPCAPTNGRPGFPFGFLGAGGRLPKARRGRVFIA